MTNLPSKPPASTEPTPTKLKEWSGRASAPLILSTFGTWLWLWQGQITAGVVILLVALMVAWRNFAKTRADHALNHTFPESSSLEMTLKRKLSRCRYLENIGNQGERAFEQYQHAATRLAKLHVLIDEKFSRGELTHGRYAGAVRDTSSGLMQNLETIATLLQSASGTARSSLTSRIAEIEGTDSTHEKASLEERLLLQEAQLRKADEILGFNEHALLELDRVSAALAEIKTRRTHGGADLDTALEELEELSARAKKYSL